MSDGITAIDEVWDAIERCRVLCAEIAYWNTWRDGEKRVAECAKELRQEIDNVNNAFNAHLHHEYRSSMNFTGGLMTTLLTSALKLANEEE